MNSYGVKQALELFLALFALYSPFAALPSYLPTLGRMDRKDHVRLAVALFVNVAVISLVSLWIGEKLLVLLGVSTAALSATGGIALMFEAVPLMLGLHQQSHDTSPEAETGTPAEAETGTPAEAETGTPAVAEAAGTLAAAEATGTGTVAVTEPPGEASLVSWRSVAFLPITFPLTIGGATIGLLISFSANAQNSAGRLVLSIAGLAYALVTGITIYLSSRLHPRLSARALELFDRIAGILLTAIAAILLTSGGTRLVVDVLNSIHG
ncbi:MAG TPA: MarC family protein [Streptosporangiaceae bacterium]